MGPKKKAKGAKDELHASIKALLHPAPEARAFDFSRLQAAASEHSDDAHTENKGMSFSGEITNLFTSLNMAMLAAVLRGILGQLQSNKPQFQRYLKMVPEEKTDSDILGTCVHEVLKGEDLRQPEGRCVRAV